MNTHLIFDHSAYEQSTDASVIAVSDNAIALDQTCFYPVGGGQPGDTGSMVLGQQQLVVSNTYRDKQNLELVWHELDGASNLPSVGDQLASKIDWDRRFLHMRMHTCLHLLCSLIDAPVTGCGISTDKGRLDFDLPEMTLDKNELSDQLNELIIANHEVEKLHITDNIEQEIERLTRSKHVKPPIIGGAVSLVKIADIDLQPCGGTHVAGTAEIGEVVCSKIQKKSKHNRRITLQFA